MGWRGRVSRVSTGGRMGGGRDGGGGDCGRRRKRLRWAEPALPQPSAHAAARAAASAKPINSASTPADFGEGSPRALAPARRRCCCLTRCRGGAVACARGGASSGARAWGGRRALPSAGRRSGRAGSRLRVRVPRVQRLTACVFFWSTKFANISHTPEVLNFCFASGFNFSASVHCPRCQFHGELKRFLADRPPHEHGRRR